MDNDKLVKVEFIESYIKHGNGDYQWNDNHGELIRCKDCKHLKPLELLAKQCCTLLSIAVSDDWYCADGKRKDGDGYGN